MRKRTPGFPPDVQPLIRVRMKQLHDDCESYAKIVLFKRTPKYITMGSAKVTKMSWGRWGGSLLLFKICIFLPGKNIIPAERDSTEAVHRVFLLVVYHMKILFSHLDAGVP